MLSKYDLFTKTGGGKPNDTVDNFLNDILWLLFYADGQHSLFAISKTTGIPMEKLYLAAEHLERKGLVKRLS